MDLDDAIEPWGILFSMSKAFDVTPHEAKMHLKRKIEKAIIICAAPNFDFARELLLAWACLVTNSTSRPRELFGHVHPDIDTYASGECGATPSFEEMAQSIKSGNTSELDLSYVRHRFCQKYGSSLLKSQGPLFSNAITPEHIELTGTLIVRFSPDCPFKITGDSMSHIMAMLSCPSWSTGLRVGNLPPIKMATKFHGKYLNSILQPYIKSPTDVLAREACGTAKNESKSAFCVICTLIRELIPSCKILLEGDIFRLKGLKPALFYMTDTDIPGVVEQSAYGIRIEDTIYIYNGLGIMHMVTDYLYILYMEGEEDAFEVCDYVFNHRNISDRHRLFAYR